MTILAIFPLTSFVTAGICQKGHQTRIWEKVVQYYHRLSTDYIILLCYFIPFYLHPANKLRACK